jgi:hypothetical protein
MAETTVENQVCQACGAEVRKGSLFCYSCGASVSAEIPVVKKDKNEVISETDFKATAIPVNVNGKGTKQKQINQEVKKIVVEETLAAPIEKSNSADQETKLKSAAAIRKTTKSIQPKKVEIIWEEHENTPNVWFIAVTIFLTILAGVVLFLAVRLK